MSQIHNLNVEEDNDLKKVIELVLKNYKLFIFSLILAFGIAVLKNYITTPVYKVSASLLIKEDNGKSASSGINDYLNSNLFGKNENFQNELWVLQSLPVFKTTVKNINLTVSYYQEKDYKTIDLYNNHPFRILIFTISCSTFSSQILYHF